MACQGAEALPERARARNHLYAEQVSAIDLFSPLPQTRSGNNVALVILHVGVTPCPSLIVEGTTVARALDEQIFAYFGVP